MSDRQARRILRAATWHLDEVADDVRRSRRVLDDLLGRDDLDPELRARLVGLPERVAASEAALRRLAVGAVVPVEDDEP